MNVTRVTKLFLDKFAGLQDTDGETTIAPFAPFTILYGHNASGKTSTVRAFAFVLGDCDDSKTNESGRVAMTISKGNGEKIFERSRKEMGDKSIEDKYLVDTVEVTEKEYLDELASTGVVLSMRKHMVHIDSHYAETVLLSGEEIAQILEAQSDKPELKAEYDALKQKLESAVKKSKKADSTSDEKRALEKLREDLKTLKQRRRDNFNSLYEPLAARVDGVYKSIYASSSVSMKLVPTNKEEPFLGVTFSCLPIQHGNVVFDLEDLSVGERKIASVVFLLALNLLKSSLFVVFDEFDKAFHEFTSKTVGPMLKETGKDIQVIVVCNDKYMRRSADRKFRIQFEEN